MSERISYVDAGGGLGAKPIVLLDRVFGALLAFFGMALTLLISPLILSVGSPGLPIFQLHDLSWRLMALMWWGALWLIPIAIAGWVAGFPKVLDVFSHIWFTPDPPTPRLSGRHWCALIVV
ncbi:MAG: hypothetical protein LH481_01020, partial [Burkholderiales bacterium]|nr:hypothetical protein [Burkholderiales bacterium]